jgi:hypothetical protein
LSHLVIVRNRLRGETGVYASWTDTGREGCDGVRAYVDIERDGELAVLVTVPGAPGPVRRSVAWAGPTTRNGARLLVEAAAAGDVPDAADLAAAVDQGGASPEELKRYGRLLFDAAFGRELWRRLVDAAVAAHLQPEAQGPHGETLHGQRLGMPYLELAIRGGTAGDQGALQTLRWEALHDGSRAVAARGTARSADAAADGEADSDARDVAVGVVRLVPADGLDAAVTAEARAAGAYAGGTTQTAEDADGTGDAFNARAASAVGAVGTEAAAREADASAASAALAGGLLIGRIPRVLFAVGSALTDPAVRPAAELMGIVQDLDRDGGSIHPKIVESATRASLRAALRGFQPDVLHLIGHGGRLPDGQVTVQFRPDPAAPGAADQWLTAEQLLDMFQAAGHVPGLVILSACQTASANASADGALTSAAQAAGDRVNAAPFAARLVADGVPVVVAMAGDVADTACRVFTRALTYALGLGVPLGKAVLWGRRAAFYQRPGFWSTDWALPTVFLAAHLPEQARLVDPAKAEAVRKLVNRLGLAQAPIFYGRREFVDAMDRLLDGGDPLNVLLAHTPDSRGSYGGERLLRQLGARALRTGALPVLLGPFDQFPPTDRQRLAEELTTSVQNICRFLGLPNPSRELRLTAVAGDQQARAPVLASALRADLEDLAADLPVGEPVWSRAPGQPRVVLLCHRVDGWLDALEDLLGMLCQTGLGAGTVPIPVVATGADVDPLRSVRLQRWNGKPWVKAAPLGRLPTADDEDLLAYLWWLLNPPADTPVYAPLRNALPGWRGLLRREMERHAVQIYDEDTLFGWARVAQDYFTSEMDHDLIATFARAAP